MARPKPPAANTNRAPISRSFAQWTPALLLAAEITADGGSLKLAADLCDALRADPRVRSAIETLTQALLRITPTFERAGDKRRAGRAVKALEVGEDWWTMLPEPELSELIAWGVMLNVGIGRLEWEDQPSGRVLPRLRVRHPRHLRQDPLDLRRWLLTVEDGREITVTPGDREWVIFSPYGGSKPQMLGAWRAVAPYVLGRTYAWSDWQAHNAFQGGAIRVVEAPVGAQEPDRQRAAEDAAATEAGGTLCLPPGFKLLTEETNPAAGDTFQNSMQTAAVEIALTLLGQNLSSEVSENAGTGATLHAEVKSDRVAGLGESVSTCVHDQVLVPWAGVNFGDEQLAPWPAWAIVTAAMLTAKAAAMKGFGEALKTLRAALQGTGLGLKPETLKSLAADFGLSLDEVEETTPPPTDKPPPKGADEATDDEATDDEDASGTATTGP